MFDNNLIYTVILIIASLYAYTSEATTIPDGANPVINVGGVDTFLAEDVKQGNTDAEALWVQGVLGDATINWTVKVHNVPYVQTIEDPNVWAFDLLLEPDYFIVKNSNRIALFANVASLDYGVFDATSLSSGLNLPTDPWIISHVTSLDGSGGGGTNRNNVPEAPLTILLGLGLMGLGFIRRIA